MISIKALLRTLSIPSAEVLCGAYLTGYRELLEKLNLKAGECLMVGNDVVEDGAAQKVDIPVFLLTSCLINTQGKDISAIPHGGFNELAAYLDRLESPAR